MFDLIRARKYPIKKKSDEDCARGFLETLSAIPDTSLFSANRPFHFYLVNGYRQKQVLFEGRFEVPKKYEPVHYSDSVTEKVESGGGKDTLQFPVDGPPEKPQSPTNYQGISNTNQKPVNDNKFPLNYRPPNIPPQQTQHSAPYSPEGFGSPPHSYSPDQTYNPYPQSQTARPPQYTDGNQQRRHSNY